MIKYKFYDKESNLMRTYSDLENMNLHKVGTQEVYPGAEEDGPIDLVDHIVIEEGEKSPRSRFIYEEVPAVEEEIRVEEVKK